MAAAEKEAEEQAQAVPKSKLPLVIGAIVVLVGGGGGAFMLFKGGEEKQKKAASTSGAPEIGPLLPMDSIIVNLDEPGGNRYLKTSFDLELTEPLPENLRKLLPRLRDRVLLYLSAFTVEQTKKSKTKLAMKKRITEIGNKVFERKIVKTVYFKEMVMQ